MRGPLAARASPRTAQNRGRRKIALVNRKLLLTAHLIVSLGWFGALLVFFAHAVAGVASGDEQIVRAVSMAMALCAWFVILPLSLATVVTGVAQALTTAWGLLRHHWLVFKLFLTALATVVLLLKLAPISQLAAAASSDGFSISTLFGLRISLLVHAACGLIVLLAAAVLAIYKPAGLTPFAAPAAVTPRWVKVCGATALALLVILIAMVALGGHGPHPHH